jgi:uncharacterized protein YqhQ
VADKLRLGGMALRNGLLVHGPTHWAASVRRRDGSIATASGRKPHLNGFEKVPGARGVIRLGSMAAATAGGRLVRRRGSGPGMEAAAAAISLMPSIVALKGGDLAAYHGVEHKSIAAYENDTPDAADAAKEHDRCGSHLMAPLLASNLAGAALLRRVVDRPGPAAQLALGIASLGLAVEIFVWSERHAGSRTARALRRPGHELQRLLGTREPTERQLEVGRAALAEILRAEGSPVQPG